MLDSNSWRTAGVILTALALAGATYLAIQSRWGDAAVTAGFVVTAILFAIWRDRLPSLFTFLFTLVAAINAAGYVFNLFASPVWFDEFVHQITPFAIVAALGWLFISRSDGYPATSPTGYIVSIVLLGIAIGLVWEGFEWLVGIIGSTHDTLIDLVMDSFGSLLAALFCLAAARSEETKLDSRRSRSGGS